MGNDNKTEIEKLLKDWENDPFHDKNSFIKDGIVCHEKWENQSPKILIFAKEGYTKGSGPMDLREEIIESAPYRNWCQAARWIYAIIESTKNMLRIPDYKEFIKSSGEKEWEEGNALLQSIAIVDLKKSNGLTLSNYNDLNKYLEHDKDRLKSQMDLINPNIVLCASTFNYYKAIYKEDIFTKIEETNKCYIHNNRLIIDFWHFAVRKYKHETFDELCDILFKGKVFDKIDFRK